MILASWFQMGTRGFSGRPFLSSLFFWQSTSSSSRSTSRGRMFGSLHLGPTWTSLSSLWSSLLPLPIPFGIAFLSIHSGKQKSRHKSPLFSDAKRWPISGHFFVCPIWQKSQTNGGVYSFSIKTIPDANLGVNVFMVVNLDVFPKVRDEDAERLVTIPGIASPNLFLNIVMGQNLPFVIHKKA